MKERPIIFSGPMVRAILGGRKTQTRRVVKPQPTGEFVDKDEDEFWWSGETAHVARCPYGRPGDRLWVRESFCHVGKETPKKVWEYRADYSAQDLYEWAETIGIPWKSGRFMPRAASRITLEIVTVRVERLQEISRDDAIAEGVFLNANDYWTAGEMAPGKVLRGLETPEHAYGRLWEHINGTGSWMQNPWVWVIEFKRI